MTAHQGRFTLQYDRDIGASAASYFFALFLPPFGVGARFNAEGAKAAYARLAGTLEAVYDRGVTETGFDVSHGELSVLFADAWTVVRSRHSIFEIIRKEKMVDVKVPHQDLVCGEVITRARNKMDHIPGSIGNYAKRTAEPMAPLLGIITACLVPKCSLGNKVEELHGMVLSHSDFHHAIDLKTFPDDDDLYPFSGWIAHIRLHAFEYIVELSKVNDFVGRLLHALNAANLASPSQRLNCLVTMRGTLPFDVSWTGMTVS